MPVRAQNKGDTLDLELFGVVGDGWSEDGITSAKVRKSLKDAGGVATINVALSSIGGLVDEGLEVYQMLSDHPARVVVTVGAQAISCGSLIAIAGDERILHASSLWCSHNPWMLCCGDYNYLNKASAELKTMATVFAQAYAAQTGKSVEEIQTLMDEDKIIDAEEALAWGFCTKIIPSKKKASSEASKMATKVEFAAMKTEARSRLTRFAAMSLRAQGEAVESASALDIECARVRSESLSRLSLI